MITIEDNEVRISGLLTELVRTLPDDRWHKFVIYLRRASDDSAEIFPLPLDWDSGPAPLRLDDPV